MLSESNTEQKSRDVIVIESIEDLRLHDLIVDNVRPRTIPEAVLMCEPTFFDVLDVKNNFMAQATPVDTSLAKLQWQELKQAIEQSGWPVRTISAVPDLQDMVFSANQAFVGKGDNDSKAYIVPSKMRHAARQKEVPYYCDWFRDLDYRVLDMPIESVEVFFEGHGDAIWHYDRSLVWGGWGFRTTKNAYALLAELTGSPVILLELADSTFYHLDTAFCVLDRNSVMVYEDAFKPDSLRLIKTLFENVISVSKHDAFNFACNAVALDKKVLLQKGSRNTVKQLAELGFDSIELDTSEFMKSGGSVFCLTCDIYV